MDVERKGVARRKKIRLAIIITICLALVHLVTMGLESPQAGGTEC
jgi:hypothetical protein